MLPELFSDVQKCFPFVILKFLRKVFFVIENFEFLNKSFVLHELTGIIFIVSGVTRLRDDIIHMI